MAKSYRYDPYEDNGGDHRKPSRQELKRQRKERHKQDERLDELMEREDDGR